MAKPSLDEPIGLDPKPADRIDTGLVVIGEDGVKRPLLLARTFGLVLSGYADAVVVDWSEKIAKMQAGEK